MKNLLSIWNNIYDGERELPESFIEELKRAKEDYKGYMGTSTTWYKDAVIYATYGDLFNKDLLGLADKLDHLESLGVSCLWLLPVLESPMKDAGFDISDYEMIRAELLGLPEGAPKEARDEVFKSFIDEVHRRGIRVIFDIAMNHCSVEHKWFKEAEEPDSPKRDYFIWSDSKERYKQARIIFKGMMESNWEYHEKSGQYYFHRFFEIQPDLNYRNPKVLMEMTRTLIGWKLRGIDGFRVDAVPYLWKEEGTNCENLPKTHQIVKFFRAALDYISEGTLLLAEACQPPVDVVSYFGDSDECHAAYHFPVMPRIYRAMAEENKEAIEMALSPSFTPEIPDEAQWFMFLRCHDELTLEMVTPKERKFIYDFYVKKDEWDFRQGEGISARLSDLLGSDKRRIKLAYSIMFTLLGTPIIYYGDEFAKGNDEKYFDEMYKMTGYKDSRYLVRGRIDWDKVQNDLASPDSLAHSVYQTTKEMISARKEICVFGRGSLRFIDLGSSVLAYEREYEGRKASIIQNLSKEDIYVDFTTDLERDYLGSEVRYENGKLHLAPYGVLWL